MEEAGSDFRLEKREQQDGTVQLSFFQTDPDPVVKALKALKIDEMTPLDALTKLYELKRLIDEE